MRGNGEPQINCIECWRNKDCKRFQVYRHIMKDIPCSKEDKKIFFEELWQLIGAVCSEFTDVFTEGGKQG